MENTLYERIKYLCHKNGISVSKLESDLGFGSSSIKKWERTSSPSIDKIAKVANYFHVSSDYLIGLTDIESPVAEILGDDDLISFQRARKKMTPRDREKSMQILRIGFDYAWTDNGDDYDE